MIVDKDMDKFTLTQEESLLMIIDIQERLVPAMSHGQKVISNISTLISIFNRLGIPIIVTEQYPKGLGRTVHELNCKIEGAAFHEKIAFSGCTDEVLSVLKQKGKRKILIVGMETHVCVLQTVRDLMANGYQAFVIGDAVCSRTKENYLNGLSQMSAMGAVVTNTETVFFDLMKKAGTELFRELSKLIK